MFRKSQDIQVDPGDSAVKVTLPASKKRIHVIQFKQSLTPTNHYYCMEIVKLSMLNKESNDLRKLFV